MIINNDDLSLRIREKYSGKEIGELLHHLNNEGTFEFRSLHNGLFPAAQNPDTSLYTGYDHVWVRDNVYVSFAHYLINQPEISISNCRALLRFFKSQFVKIEKIIYEDLDPDMPMNRPHIRFNGRDLCESAEKWAHAQNDAIGYFIWHCCQLINDGILKPEKKDIVVLASLVLFLTKIEYWRDMDSGHWEETRKVSASSIGVVIKGLKEFRKLLSDYPDEITISGIAVSISMLDAIIDKGHRSLLQILPCESADTATQKGRKYDAALLFLIFPMEIVSESMSDRILSDVWENLSGDYGIKRYQGDSFWTADYTEKMDKKKRTAVFSENLRIRDALHQPGDEAQWCIFDPVISIIYGRKYQKTKNPEYIELQTRHFNRSLGQITGNNDPSGPNRCPELYYKSHDKYIPNDTVPLLWTQANLRMAFKVMLENHS